MAQSDTPNYGGDLLDEQEAAVYLSKPAGTLKQWRHRGLGPDYVKLGMSIRYQRSALERFVTENTVQPGRAS